CVETAIVGHPREFRAHNLVLAPAGAELHGKRNLYRGADALKDGADARQIAQQSRTTVALHHAFGRTAKIQVNDIEAQLLHNLGGAGENFRVAAKKLRRDRMFVLVEMQIALALGLAAAEESVGRGELGHDEAAGTIAGCLKSRFVAEFG